MYLSTINYFFDQPMKSEQEAYEHLIEVLINNNYITGNLLDYWH